MKFFSQSDASEMLKNRGISISPSRDLLFPNDSRLQKIFARIRGESLTTTYLVDRLSTWIPESPEIFLWVKNWETHPVFEKPFFENARAMQSKKTLTEFPGQSFVTIQSDVQSEMMAQQDSAILSGLVLLILCFDWEAYLLFGDGNDAIYLSDEHITFMSGNTSHIELAKKIFKEFGMDAR